MSTGPRYQLVLESTSTPDDLAGVRALRRLLKALLRRFGFRCIACQRVVEPDRIVNPDGEYSYRYDATEQPTPQAWQHAASTTDRPSDEQERRVDFERERAERASAVEGVPW